MVATPVTGDTLASMNGLVKEKYAKQIQNAVPDTAKLLKTIKFSKATMVGNFYHQPVILQNEVGFTYNAGGSSTIFGYNEVGPMQMVDAQVAPTQLLLRSKIGYEVMNRAKQAGEEAFEAATMLLIKNMVDSMALRLEMSLLYGGSGLGTIASMTYAGGVATTATVTITQSAWAVGLWQGQETSYLDFYNAGGTIINVTTVPSATAPRLETLNPSTRVLSISGTAVDLAALKTYVDANPSLASIYWGGSFGQEMVGLKTIITNTGTLFNINAAVYDLWRGNTVAVGGVALSQALIQQAVAVCSARGLQDEELLLVCSNEGWADLMTSQAALRMYDQSYSTKKMENGSKELAFNSQNGSIKVMAHPMCKDGDAFLIPTKQLLRVGACEPTFEVPGLEARLPFVPLEGSAGVQIVRYSSQQVFLQTPARSAFLSGIVNTSSAI